MTATDELTAVIDRLGALAERDADLAGDIVAASLTRS